MNNHDRIALSCALAVIISTALLPASITFADHAKDIAMAKKLMTAFRYKDAAALLETLQPKLSGDDAIEMQVQLGMAYRFQYQHDKAIPAFEKLLEMPGITDNHRSTAYKTMGLSYQLSNRLDQAIENYKKAAALKDASPDSIAEAHLRRGYALGRRGDHDEAVEAFLQCSTTPGNSTHSKQIGYVTAGMTRQKQLQYEEAAKHYRSALAISTRGSAAHRASNYLLECEAAMNADPHFYIAPYVSLVSTSEASIFWISREGSPTGKVTVTDGENTINADATLATMLDRDVYRQTVHLKDLKPYTLYNYTVTCGEKTASGSFHTARDKPGPVRFAVIGDTQGGWKEHNTIGKLIAAENPDFVMHVGDCVEKGSRWDEWKIQMFDPGKPYLAKSPIWVARGNHDDGAYFPIIFGREKQPWQTFTFGDVQVFILDSNYFMGITTGKKQLTWLEEQFETTTCQWTIAGMHHSLFHTANGDRLIAQQNFRPLIEKASPDMMFNGHYHKYSRQLPIGKTGRKPLINVVTGGGGGGNGTPSTPSPIVAKVYESFHYCVISIEGNKLHHTAKDINGQVIDEYELIKTDGKFQPEVMQKAVDPDTFKAIRMVYSDLKYPHYNRVDLTGVFEDGTVTLDRHILKVELLPKDTKLVIDRTNDTAWWLEPQELNLSKGEFTFKADPPKGASLSDPTTAGPLKIKITAKLEGRLFEPRSFPVTLRVN